MKPAIAILLTLHAFLHLLGAAKAFKWAEPDSLAPVSRPWGMWWVFAFVVLIVAVVVYLFNVPYWWVVGLMGVGISQFLVFKTWHDTKWGTVPNVVFLLPILIAFIQFLPSSFQSIFKKGVAEGLAKYTLPDLLTESDIRSLPLPVQKYLRYTGSVDKPKVWNLKAEFEGDMKTSPDADWAPIKARQYSFFDEPTRLFLIESHLKSVPYEGLHVYKGANATMRIRIASLFEMVDAKGALMNQSETVTLFNDMCILAPATLVNKSIQWQTIDSLTVKATFTNQGNTIKAILYFATEGQLIRFVSYDRYMSSDGQTYLNYKWSTPVSEYKEMDGRKLATVGEAIWELPERDFPYARFVTKSVQFNIKE